MVPGKTVALVQNRNRLRFGCGKVRGWWLVEESDSPYGCSMEDFRCSGAVSFEVQALAGDAGQIYRLFLLLSRVRLLGVIFA